MPVVVSKALQANPLMRSQYILWWIIRQVALNSVLIWVEMPVTFGAPCFMGNGQGVSVPMVARQTRSMVSLRRVR